MRVAVSPALGEVTIVDEPMPTIGAGEILLRMQACGICGTDMMKVDTPGVTRPFRLGHELVGTVEAVGAGTRFQPGQRVAVAHHVPDFGSHYTRRGSAPMDALFKQTNIDPGGFAEFVRIPALHVQHTTVNLPDSMSLLRGVFMEPLACCLRALDRLDLLEGDTVLLVGAGAAGLLFAPLLRDRSVRLIASDVRPERLLAATEWGAWRGVHAGQDGLLPVVMSATEGRGADVVILTVSGQAQLDTAFSAVRDGGTILLFGVKPGALAQLDLWQLWRREINLITSYSATPDLLPRAMAILGGVGYPLEKTISHSVTLADAATGFQFVRDGSASKVVIIRE